MAKKIKIKPKKAKKKKYTGKPRGFAHMKLTDPDRLQSICRLNGLLFGRRWTASEARRYGAKGGKAKRRKPVNEREGTWQR